MRGVLMLLLFPLMTGPLVANTSAAATDDLLEGRPDGTYRFTYPVREGVHGDGSRRVIHIDEDGDGFEMWDAELDQGPARVEVEILDGEVRDVDVRVGGRARRGRDDAVDLGEVDPVRAARTLLRIVATARERAAAEAVHGAVIARGATVWPELLAVVQDRSRPDEVRQDALFWVARDAAEAAVGPLSELVDAEDEDVELREHAVFAISQLPEETALPLLLDIARGHRHPEVQRAAFIWLADYDDPEVLNLFEEILVSR